METGAWCDFSLHGTVFAKLFQCDFKMNTEQAREARKENKKASSHCQIQTHLFGVQICVGLSVSEMSASSLSQLSRGRGLGEISGEISSCGQAMAQAAQGTAGVTIPKKNMDIKPMDTEEGCGFRVNTVVGD